MYDNDLIKIFLPVIDNGLIDRGLNISATQSYQPLNQGIELGESVYFFKVSDNRRGTTGIYEEWNILAGEKIRTEVLEYETTFQVNAYSIQDPSNTNQLTASDIVNVVLEILQSQDTIITFRNAGVGILRISDVRNPYFNNERSDFEASANFDFTLSYKRTREKVIPIVTELETNILVV